VLWQQHQITPPAADNIHGPSSFSLQLEADLGHIISAGGDAMDADKVAMVTEWSVPRSAHGLRGFLGWCDKYHLSL